jgi:iron complex outermembrane recepter protein
LGNQQVIGVLVDPVNRVFLDFRGAPIPFVTGSTPDLETNEVTPHLNLAYHWSSDIMTYLSYSQGYKSGGYEQRLAPGTPAVPSFRPEYVDSFETGIKVSAPGAGVTISAAAFHSKYKDMQISVVDGPSPTLTNAGDATLNGGEIEVAWRPVRDVSLSAFASYLDAGYDSLTQRVLNSGVRPDSALPNVSKWQAGASFDASLAVGRGLELRPHADWAWRSGLYLDSANTPLLHQQGYSLLNAALTLVSADDRWSLSLSGRNLLNEIYLVSGIAQYNIGEIEGQVARPREWALSAKIRF